MSRIRFEVMKRPCASGIKVYVDGERIYRVESIDADDLVRESGKEWKWKVEENEYGETHSIEFEAEIETTENGNKRVYLHGKYENGIEGDKDNE